MQLLEAIIDANHRALAGDANAGLHPAEFEKELPLVALTCVDVRLNALLPQVLGVPPEQFIWLRNAGNIITGPLSSTMRSLALACAVKGGQEIVIIGHTDCQVGKTSTMELLERLGAMGIPRQVLPDNLNEFFGTFGSDRQNVIKSAAIARSSPLIGPKIPVHGLLVDVETGKLEWLVNGYESLGALKAGWNEALQSIGQKVDELKASADLKIGEVVKASELKLGEVMKIPETRIGQAIKGSEAKIGEALKGSEAKIGEVVSQAGNWVSEKLHELQVHPSVPVPPPAAPVPPPMPAPRPILPSKIPLPPPLRPRMTLRKGSK